MADINVQVVISAIDRASSTLQNFGGTAQAVHSKFADLVKASTIASVAFEAALIKVGKSIIDTASDMQQAKVGFTTMLGSAEAATKTLKDLSDFAKTTPFTFPSIVEASQRLLAYNVEAQDLIPTLRNLGDIAAGVGMEKMPQLILAFGQVKAATRLTGMELRQFSEAGVPLLQALVDQLNEGGGALVKVGGTSDKVRGQIDTLTTSLEKQNNRFKEMTEKGNTTSASYKNLQIDIEKTKGKLADLGTVSEGSMQRVKVTADDVRQMISDGEISFEQVQKALQGMTGEGGKFFDLMNKQSQTFAGRVSNIQDQMVRLALNIAGISTEAENFGDVIEGGAFDMLSDGVQKVLDAMNELEPQMQGLIKGFTENQAAIGAAFGILIGGLAGATVALWAFLWPILALMAAFAALGFAIGYIIQHFNEWKLVAEDVAGTIGEFFTVQIPDMISNAVDSVIAFLQKIPDYMAQTWIKTWTEQIPFAIGFLIGYLFTAIPNLVSMVIDTFSKLPPPTLAIWFGVRDLIIAAIKAAAEWLFNEISTWPGRFIHFLSSLPGIVMAIFERVKQNTLDQMKWTWEGVTYWWEKIKGVLESIKNAAQAAFDAVKRGFEAGQNFAGKQAGGIVPGPIDQPQMVLAHGGEEVVPVNSRSRISDGGGGGMAFTVNIGIYAGSEIEKRQIARELYASLAQLAAAENKTVAEMMGR